MAHHSSYSKATLKNSYDYRLGLPLLLITVFCFVLVFVTIGNSNKHQAALASKSSKSVAGSSKQSALKVALPSTQLQTMNPVDTSPTTSLSDADQPTGLAGGEPTSSPLSSIKTAMPQSNSSATAISLQPASKSTTTKTQPINTVTIKNGKKIITNLVNSIL